MAHLSVDDVLVDLASREVVLPREGDVEVAFVVAEVEVRFAAVVEDKDLA
jgi:hypothetical protein